MFVVYSIEWTISKKYGNGLFSNSILFWSVGNSGLVDDSIAVAEGMYNVINKF